jgi:HSP20 family protein
MALVRFTRRPARLAFQPFAGFPGFEDFENRVQKVMENMLTEADAGSTAIGWVPVMEITESPTEMIASAELPGIDRKDVEISVDDDMLTISGEKSEEKASEEKKYHVWERSYGSFRRSFSLPRGVDASKINAEFKNGVLKVHMPKTNEAQAKGRKIEIAAK